MAYIFGSIWDRVNRNALNNLSKSVEYQGKSIQDLVAEGQLTPTQYETLIQSVNGLISKGEISVDDINTNLGKLQLKHLSEEVKTAMTGDTPILSEVEEGAVTRSKIAPKAVSPTETDFFNRTANLASGDYLNWSIHNDNGKWFLQSERTEFHGMLKMIKISPSKKYTIKIFEPHLSNRFRVATSEVAPNFGSGYAFESIEVLKTDDVGSEFTFTSSSNARYLYVYVSNDWLKPKIQVENSSEITDYIDPYVIPKNFFFTEIENDFIKVDNTVTVFEDRLQGYPDRPNATSVIWIGVNEPTQVEPYDEWRETSGFTYYTDFQEYKSYNQMVDWSAPFLRDYSAEILGGTNGNTLRFNPNSHGRFVLAWDKMSDDPNRDSTEVFSEMKVDRITQSLTAGVFLNGSGNSVESITGYGAGFLSNSDDEIELWLVRYLNGSSSTLASSPFSIDLTKNINWLVRAENSQIKLKVWQDGYEPNLWKFEVRDDDFLTGEITGLLNTGRSSILSVSKFGVATGGMKAPKRRLRL